MEGDQTNEQRISDAQFRRVQAEFNAFFDWHSCGYIEYRAESA